MMTDVLWWILYGVGVLVSVPVFLVLVLLTAKVASYGWAAGRQAFDNAKRK